jgi:hypothetical protein
MTKASSDLRQSIPYNFMSRQQSAGQNHNIKQSNGISRNVNIIWNYGKIFKLHSRRTLERTEFEEYCYHAFHCILSSSLLSIIVKVKIYKIINVSVFFFVRYDFCFTSREEHVCLKTQSLGIYLSIVSDYGLDDREIGVRFPAEVKDFSSSFCVQICSGAHPASCTICTKILTRGYSAAGA